MSSSFVSGSSTPPAALIVPELFRFSHLGWVHVVQSRMAGDTVTERHPDPSATIVAGVCWHLAIHSPSRAFKY